MAGIGIHSLRAILRGKLYVANRYVDSIEVGEEEGGGVLDLAVNTKI